MTDEDLDFERGRSKWSKFNNEGRGGVARGGFPNSYSEYKEYKRTRVYEQGGIGGNQKRSKDRRPCFLHSSLLSFGLFHSFLLSSSIDFF